MGFDKADVEPFGGWQGAANKWRDMGPLEIP